MLLSGSFLYKLLCTSLKLTNFPNIVLGLTSPYPTWKQSNYSYKLLKSLNKDISKFKKTSCDLTYTCQGLDGPPHGLWDGSVASVGNVLLRKIAQTECSSWLSVHKLHGHLLEDEHCMNRSQKPFSQKSSNITTNFKTKKAKKVSSDTIFDKKIAPAQNLWIKEDPQITCRKNYWLYSPAKDEHTHPHKHQQQSQLLVAALHRVGNCLLIYDHCHLNVSKRAREDDM